MKISGAYPSNYVKSSDLNGKPCPLTIRTCVLEELGQGSDKEPCNESTISPPPPGRGKRLWFGRNLEIRNVGPVRDGLPPVYALHRGGQEVMRSNWNLCLAKAEKLLDGVPLPKGKLADTRTETVPLHVRADQLPPLPQRGYATRRHAR